MRLAGASETPAEFKIIKKTGVTEAHKARLADVRRAKLNHAR